MPGARRAVEVDATCRSCGKVRLSAAALRCALDSDNRTHGLCEFRCPLCGRLMLRPVLAEQGELLLEAGAGPLDDPVPFELLERPAGPPLTRDDLLDLHLALRRTRWPQAELLT